MSCCDQSVVSVGQRARTVRLEFVAGDDFPLRLTFASNLTGYTAEADVVSAAGSVIQTFAIATEYLTNNGVTSTRYSLSLTRAQTTAMATQDGARWSFRLTAPGDKKRTYFLGRVICVKR